MCHRANTECVPICQPMYYHQPFEDRCYPATMKGRLSKLCGEEEQARLMELTCFPGGKGSSNQFYFGSQLVVSSIASKNDRTTLRGQARSYLPPGGTYCVTNLRFDPRVSSNANIQSGSTSLLALSTTETRRLSSTEHFNRFPSSSRREVSCPWTQPKNWMPPSHRNTLNCSSQLEQMVNSIW